MGNREERIKPIFIVHVIDSLGLGGAEKLLVNTISVLDDYEHVICTLGDENRFEKIGNGNVKEIVPLGFHSNKDFLKSILRLRKVLKRYNPSLVHAHLLKSTWITRLAVTDKFPMIFSIHNLLSEDAFKVNRLSYYFEKWTYRKSQAVIGVSAQVLKDYDQWIGIKSDSYVLYNLVEQEFFKEKLSYTSIPEVKLVAVGNLRRQKNYYNLVNAFTLLKNAPISLDIYGEGEDRPVLEKLIQEFGLPVTLKGRSERISEVLPQYDAYVLASLFEGYGIAAMEGMAMGMPVLLSDIDVFKEVTGGKGVFFNPSDPQDIADKLLQFSQMNIIEKMKLGQELKEQAKSLASPSTFKGNLIKIYQSQLKKL